MSVPMYKIVADAWHGPANGMHVDHVNADPLDDRPANLQYLDPMANNRKGTNGEAMSDADWEDMLDA